MVSILCVGVAANDVKPSLVFLHAQAAFLKHTDSLNIELIVTVVFRRFSVFVTMYILYFCLRWLV